MERLSLRGCMKICVFKTNSTLRAGFTLVEVMIALLMLSILTIGGAAMLSRASETIAYQEHKRAAIEAANQRMEMIRATPYTAFDGYLSGVSLNAWVLLKWAGTTFEKYSDSGSSSLYVAIDGANVDAEAVQINRASMNMVTRIRRVQRSPTGSSLVGKCIELDVIVDYRPGSGDLVRLQSLYR